MCTSTENGSRCRQRQETGSCAAASSPSCTAWWSAWAPTCCRTCPPRCRRCCRPRRTARTCRTPSCWSTSSSRATRPRCSRCSPPYALSRLYSLCLELQACTEEAGHGCLVRYQSLRASGSLLQVLPEIVRRVHMQLPADWDWTGRADSAALAPGTSGLPHAHLLLASSNACFLIVALHI